MVFDSIVLSHLNVSGNIAQVKQVDKYYPCIWKINTQNPWNSLFNLPLLPLSPPPKKRKLFSRFNYTLVGYFLELKSSFN